MSIELGGSRVLVTGGAGFIGSHIVDQMIEAGADHVTIVDDFVRGRHENLADATGTGRVEVVTGDIRDAALVNRLTDGCDLVFHQAKAVIRRNRVCVAAPQVPQPRYVRYGWQPYTTANLCNGAGLPASTFFTEVPD